MKTMRLIPALTATATLALASCNCSDTPIPKEVEDEVEDVRGGIKNAMILGEDLLPTGEWLANRRLDRAIRKFILNETYDKDKNPDAGKGKKQKKSVKELKEQYQEELGLTSADARIREIDMLDRTEGLLRAAAVDKAFFGRVFENPSLAREWMEFCYLQSKTIYEGRAHGQIFVDDYKFVAITMTLFSAASKQLTDFSDDDFRKFGETIEWYEGVKSQALTNVVRIKEAKELEEQNLYMRAGTIYMEVGVGSGEALDYGLAILAVAQKMEPELARLKE